MERLGSALVHLEGVSKSYEAPGVPLAVLNGINLTVAEGESIAIVGPSGSGKSTLLNIVGTLDTPTKGRVCFEGQDLSQFDETQLAYLRNRRMGFVFQLHHLLPQCTALENVLIPTLVTRPKDSRAEQMAYLLLERVGLKDRQNAKPASLSGGERQRVALVRALINEPSLLLADEPTGALDYSSSMGLADLLSELNHNDGVTMIVVSHSLDIARRMNRILELRDGTLRERDDLK
ncbi:MAG TPA: ABC transporter ATP-binding protein [bacterium]|nr:ABC transporter ATP-binding protein [bacterium]